MSKLKQRCQCLGTTILLGILATGMLSLLSFSYVLYQVKSEASETLLAETSQAVLRPIMNLATRGINGGNEMKLRGQDAQFMYASSGVLYLQISGTSKSSPKTPFLLKVSMRS